MKRLKKFLAMLLAAVMCMSVMGGEALAKEGEDEAPETIWYGDEISVDVKAGTNGYTFRSVYGGDSTDYANYETSNHILNIAGGAVSLLPMVYAGEDYTWKPSGLYEFGNSNYEVMYCCDFDTDYLDNVYYKRINLEDSDYYDADAAEHIRAIVTNSYPYVSLDQMKDNLAENGFEFAEELDRAEVLAAVQSAIWYFANGKTIGYGRTADINYKAKSWGGVMHDYSAEMSQEVQNLNNKYKEFPEVGARIDALIEYLKELKGTYAEKNQIVISELKVVNEPVQLTNGGYNVALQVVLNNSGSSDSDDIVLNIYSGDELVKTTPVELGKEVYDLVVEVQADQAIKAVVSGKQTLPKGVYFYEPEGGRDVSQCLVGVAEGETDVYAEAQVELDIEDTSVVADLKVKKVDNSGNALAGAEFALSVVGQEVTLPVGIFAVDENGQLAIDDLLPGSYELKETVTPAGCIALDEVIKFVVDEQGVLKLGEETNTELVSCTNVEGVYLLEVVNNYIPTELVIDGEKYLDGELAEGFEFALMQGEEVLETVISKEDGTFAFTALTFDKLGVYTYKVVEVEGNEEDIIYDDTVYEVTVTVSKGEQNISAVASYTKDGTAYTGKVTFENETELVEIPDEDIPLGETPEEEPSDEVVETPEEEPSDEVVEIPEEEVPLAAAPKTGDQTSTMLFVAVLVAAAMVVVVELAQRKKYNR